MSLMDKIRSFFSGGAADSHGHDHSDDGHDHVPEPVSATAPTVPSDPTGAPTAEPADEEDPPSAS
jgi:hypothetical protein